MYYFVKNCWVLYCLTNPLLTAVFLNFIYPKLTLICYYYVLVTTLWLTYKMLFMPPQFDNDDWCLMHGNSHLLTDLPGDDITVPSCMCPLLSVCVVSMWQVVRRLGGSTGGGVLAPEERGWSSQGHADHVSGWPVRPAPFLGHQGWRPVCPQGRLSDPGHHQVSGHLGYPAWLLSVTILHPTFKSLDSFYEQEQ